MQPRRPSSKKWTAFPSEFTQQIELIFKDNFKEQIGTSKLIIDGRIYPEELALRVGILEAGRLKQANFEVSVDYNPDQTETLDRIHSLVDVAASMMMDYFESEEEVEFPYTWKDFPFQGQTVYLQFNTENSDLEARANEILGVSDDSLIHEEQIGEDALDRAEKDHLH